MKIKLLLAIFIFHTCCLHAQILRKDTIKIPPGIYVEGVSPIADSIIQDIKPWIATKTELTSLDLRHRTSRHLRVYNPHAAFVYKYYDTID